MEVISRYLFAYPTASQYAEIVTSITFIVMTKHAILPKKIVSDNWSVIVIQEIKEVADVPEIAS